MLPQKNGKSNNVAASPRLSSYIFRKIASAKRHICSTQYHQMQHSPSDRINMQQNLHFTDFYWLMLMGAQKFNLEIATDSKVQIKIEVANFLPKV